MGTGAENVQQGPPPVYSTNVSQSPINIYPAGVQVQQPGTVIYTTNPATTTTVVVSYQNQIFADDKPTRAECPRCKITVTTRVENQIGACWWIICFVGFFLICWPILYILCCNVSKDATHSCPNCGLVLGRFKRAC